MVELLVGTKADLMVEKMVVLLVDHLDSLMVVKKVA